MGKKSLESLPNTTYAPVIRTQHAPHVRMFHHAYRHSPIRKLVVTGPYMLRANIRPRPSARFVGLQKYRHVYNRPLAIPLPVLDPQHATTALLHPLSPGAREKWLSLQDGLFQSR